jgi:hypothetical protein
LIVAAAGAAAVLLGCLATLRLALSPLLSAQAFLRNPFGLATRAVPEGPVVLSQIQRLERLETCRYNGQVIVRGDTQGFLPLWLAGDRMLFVGHGEVVAGVDLARLHPEDVEVRGTRVSLRLPPSEILHTRLDNRASEVFDRRSGLLTGPDRSLETRVRIEAEDRIRQAALENGVLLTAQANARDTLRRQMELYGFREVRFL